jgi:2-methylaconitate cis-trans-isomerase PrpF
MGRWLTLQQEGREVKMMSKRIKQPSCRHAVVRIHDTSAGKLIRASLGVDSGAAAVEGKMLLEGASESGAPIRLHFLEPGGTRTATSRLPGHF